MKLRLLLLVGSATLNAAFGTAFVLQPSLAPPGVRDYFQRTPATNAPSAATPRKAGPTAAERDAQAAASQAQLWRSLATDNLSDLVARLRAAGFPPTIVRGIVDAEIERRFSSRFKELSRSMNETPYWKPDPSYFMGNSKLFEEVNQIYRERSRMLRELLGQDAFAYGTSDPSAMQRRQFGDLTPAKIDLVQRISDDYTEMISQVRTATQGIMLPEDREKIAFLEREKRADLAAVLSPAELADYEMRSSPATSRLRTAMTVMDASEDEFRKIYQIQQPFSDLLYPTGYTVFTAETSEKRREAQKQISDQVKGILGEQRFAEYQRATTSEFQQLYRIGQRENVPYDTLARAFDSRLTAAEASQKIYNDRSLSTDDRRAALQQLAQTTRTQILSTLGPNAGPAYLETNRWLTHIEQGGSITVQPDGNLSYRSAAPPRPAAAPKQ